MAFTEHERDSIRERCGYPALASAVGSFQNWRFCQVYGLLEFRLNYLTGTEEAVVRRYLGTIAQIEDRTILLGWRRRLCGFLGVPPGPEIDYPAKVPTP